jgi:hypothetical protein
MNMNFFLYISIPRANFVTGSQPVVKKFPPFYESRIMFPRLPLVLLLSQFNPTNALSTS